MKAKKLTESIDNVINEDAYVNKWEILESLASPTDREVVVTAMNVLADWLSGGHSKVINQSIFLFFKRNIPDCIYTGKAYRVIWIEFLDALKKDLIKDVKQTDDLLKLTTPQVRDFLQKDKKFLSKLTSWTKSKRGITGIQRAMDYKNFYSVQILITDKVTGIDVMKAFSWLEKKIISKGSKFPTTLIRQYKSKLGKRSAERKWAVSQTEIIAPFNPSSFQIVSIKRSELV